MAKKKTMRVVESGKVFITATFNNTLVTITDETGSPIVFDSCGMHGFSGTRKSTPHAATITTEAALRKAVEEHQLRKVDVFVRGIGPGREAALRVIKGADVDIDRIVDMTPVPHNGVRPPKIRRV
jgi:small subunit ribosomal protein S11